MHRVISFILATLVIALSCIPCSDADAALACINKSTIIQPASGTEHGNHSHCVSDSCSPFCTCSCCAGFTLPQPGNTGLTLSLPAPGKVYSAYPSQDFPQVTFPVWQPPQLG